MQLEFLIRDSIYFISIIFNLTLGFFVLYKNIKEKINRAFFSTVVFLVLWLFSLFLFYTIESPLWVLWLGRFNFAIALPIFYSLLEFVIFFPRKNIIISSKIKTILKQWTILFFIITFLTSLVAKEEIITGIGQRETIYGPLFPLYIFHYVIFSISIIAILFHKIRKAETEKEKNQAQYIVIGVFLSLAFIFTTNIFLYSFGLPEAANFGPLGTIIFSSFIVAAIVKHNLFLDIRLILTQILVAVIALILLIQTLLSGPTILKVLNASVFILFCFFGYFLIKATLKEFEMRKEVEKLSNAKSEFISIASHQLRTPLTAIKGYISMISEGSYGRLTEKMKKPMENVYQSNERLVGLVNNLLNLSRLDAGKIKFEPKPGSLEEMIKSIIKELEVVIKNKGLYIRMKKPASPLPEVNIDQDHIRQVILNIIDNAAKYTKEGGITIELSKINNMEEIRVSDTGEGMDEKDLENLFQIFSRATAGIKLHTEGAGLGLHIAKRFVEMHGGKIWAESKGKNKGSSFIIQLPINFDSKLAKKYSSDKLRDDKTKKIT